MISSATILTGFRFHVALRFSPETDKAEKTIEAGFQEVSGLEIEMDVSELVEGGRNNGVVRRPGRAKNTSLVLKRGMFVSGTKSEDKANRDFWKWIQGIINGELPVRRCNGAVFLLSSSSSDGEPVPRCTWLFENGLPLKVKGPDLNAKTGDIAMEELHIAHEGLSVELPGATP